jgi:arylsulfatase A-like enzyme
MAFNRFFCGAPQCVPSRAVLMTGRSALAARMTRFTNALPRDEIIFPEILRSDAGYFTGVCGRSFHLDGPSAGPWRDQLEALLPGVLASIKTFAQRMDVVADGRGENAEFVEGFLNRVPAGRPFFLWFNTSDPHHLWNAAPELVPDPQSFPVPGYLPDTPAMRAALASHFGEINRLDQLVGRVLDVLDRRGLTQDTLVVFAGDNGWAFPSGKGSLHDPGLTRHSSYAGRARSLRAAPAACSSRVRILARLCSKRWEQKCPRA